MILESSMEYFFQIIYDISLRNFVISAMILSISGMIQGYSGFGGGTISVPVLVILFGPIIAVGMITPIYILGAATILPNSLKNVDWREVTPLSISGSISVFIGLSFLVNADPFIIKKIMGLFILLTTTVMVLGSSYNGPRNMITSILAGSLTGGVTGGTGIPGAPIMVMYYLAAKVGPKVQRANILLTGCIFSLCVIVGLARNDVYSQSIILLILLLGPIFMIATRVGQYLFTIVPAEWFKKMAYCLLVFAGMTLLII